MKDLKVIKYLVGLLSNEWDLVFDPFMWSWTTAVACKELNRNYIWTEIDERFYNVTLDRLKEVEIMKEQRLP
jgi:site-specific DNA-methyltransferase (adenine-specific)